MKYYGFDFGTSFSTIAYTDRHGDTYTCHCSKEDNALPTSFYSENRHLQCFVTESLDIQPYVKLKKDIRISSTLDEKVEVGGDIYTLRDLMKSLFEHIWGQERIAQPRETYITVTYPLVNSRNQFSTTYVKALKQMVSEITQVPLNNIYAISEPEAVAFHYAHTHALQLNEKILIVDIGGGTTDITLLQKIGENDYKLINGNSESAYKGGQDFTERITRQDSGCYINEPGLTSFDVYRHTAETIKISLSSSTIATTDQLVLFPNRQHKTINITMERSSFENACEDLFNQIKNMVQSATNGISPDKVILSGGSAQIPKIKKDIGQLLYGDPNSNRVQLIRSPQKVVALGASYYGYLLNKDNNPAVTRFDILPTIRRTSLKSYSTSVADGERVNILKKGSAFDQNGLLVGEQNFRPLRLTQTDLVFDLYESDIKGERYRINDAADTEISGAEICVKVPVGAKLWGKVTARLTLDSKTNELTYQVFYTGMLKKTKEICEPRKFKGSEVI